MSSKPYAEYKPSGIEWLGEIPEHWDPVRLRYRTKINPSRSELNGLPHELDVSFVPMESVHEYGGLSLDQARTLSEVSTGYTYFRDGDVLAAKITPCFENGKGSIAQNLLNGIGFGTTELHVLRPHSSLDRLFLFYITICHAFRHLGAAEMYGAGGQKRVPEDFVKDFRPPIPPINEQKAIASFLDRETARIDGLIEKKERQIELLQEKRQALISHAVTKGLNPNAKMKDSGIEWLGVIPEHWDLVPLRYALSSHKDAVKTGPFGSQLLSSDMVAGSIKVYNQRNVLDRDFTMGENFITEEKYQELKAFTVSPGDVLVTTRGTIGRCALLPEDAETGILHPCLMRIKPDTLKVLPEYVALIIQESGIVLLQLRLMSNATTIDVIYSESLRSVRLPLPPVSEQEKILIWAKEETAKHNRLIVKVRNSIDLLREYRTSLITSAVTGKIKVPVKESDVQESEDSAYIEREEPPYPNYFMRLLRRTEIAHKKAMGKFSEEQKRMLQELPRMQKEMGYNNLNLKSLRDKQEKVINSITPLLSTRESMADIIAEANEKAEILRKIEPNLRQTQEKINQLTQSPALHIALKQAEQAHASWRNIGHEVKAPDFSVMENVKSSMTQVSYSLDIASKILSDIDFDKITRQLSLSQKFSSQIHTTINELSKSHAELFDSINNISDVVSLPRIYLPGANREILMTGYAISRIQPIGVDFEEGEPRRLIEEASEEVSECESILERKFPQLVKPYRGAYDALNCNSEDRARHVLTSLRELVWHLLRLLAPNENVIPWIQSRSEKDLLDNKCKPTRRARLLYICRNINHGPFSTFINKDVDAMLELIDLFNQVHNIDPNFHDVILKAIVFRTETGIMFIIRTHEEANG